MPTFGVCEKAASALRITPVVCLGLRVEGCGLQPRRFASFLFFVGGDDNGYYKHVLYIFHSRPGLVLGLLLSSIPLYTHLNSMQYTWLGLAFVRTCICVCISRQQAATHQQADGVCLLACVCISHQQADTSKQLRSVDILRLQNCRDAVDKEERDVKAFLVARPQVEQGAQGQ